MCVAAACCAYDVNALRASTHTLCLELAQNILGRDRMSSRSKQWHRRVNGEDERVDGDPTVKQRQTYRSVFQLLCGRRGLEDLNDYKTNTEVAVQRVFEYVERLEKDNIANTVTIEDKNVVELCQTAAHGSRGARPGHRC